MANLLPDLDRSDPRWFRKLVDACTPFMLRMAERYARQGLIEPEEVVQVAWIRIWKHLDKVPSEERRLRPWLAVITGNVAKNLIKRAGRRREFELDEPAAASRPVRCAPDLEEAERDLIWQAVDQKLSERQGLVVKLRVFDGRSFKEIAGITGEPFATCRSLWYRALKLLEPELPRELLGLLSDDALEPSAPTRRDHREEAESYDYE